VWQRHEGRGACRPEEFYLRMAQDMLLRHRGDATRRRCTRRKSQ
jgi:hypothetical protein